MKNQGNAVVFAVNLRSGLDPGKGKSEISKIVAERLGGIGHFVGVVGLSGSNRHKRSEFVVFTQKVPFELDATDQEPVTFGDVEGDGNIRLIWQDSNLG